MDPIKKEKKNPQSSYQYVCIRFKKQDSPLYTLRYLRVNSVDFRLDRTPLENYLTNKYDKIYLLCRQS